MQYSAKFAEKTGAYACEDRFLYVRMSRQTIQPAILHYAVENFLTLCRRYSMQRSHLTCTFFGLACISIKQKLKRSCLM